MENWDEACVLIAMIMLAALMIALATTHPGH
jgi:hypothetical protein